MAKLRGLAKRAAFREYIEILGAAAVVALFARAFIVGAYRIPTDAMAPTLLPGDFVLALRLSYGIDIPFADGRKIAQVPPARGDIVVFRGFQDQRSTQVKRVIGLAGDRVAIVNGRLFVNGVEAAGSSRVGQGTAAIETTAAESADHGTNAPGASAAAVPLSFGPIVVPPGHFFVLGDNRGESEDSRAWGSVPERSLEGRVAIIWMSLEWAGDTAGQRLPAIRWPRVFNLVR